MLPVCPLSAGALVRGARRVILFALLAIGLCLPVTVAQAAAPQGLSAIQTVFVIVLENKEWSAIYHSPSAPFINTVLLPQAASCAQYYNPPGLHPSLPNYLWMEAGTNFGIFDNNDPELNHLSSTNHLVAQLRAAGISWRTYQEDISGAYVPLTYTNLYAPRHNPFVYFDDLTGTNAFDDPYGIAHNRPFEELAGNLATNNVARYNFITPNICNGMHDSCPPQYDPVRQGDDWLARVLPMIVSSAAFTNRGAIFITWDEGTMEDTPIGMMLLSPLGRAGYVSPHRYTHSSLLRTLQDIFQVRPLLADASNARDLSDLFMFPRMSEVRPAPAGARVVASALRPGSTNIFEASVDLLTWTPFSTNVSSDDTLQALDTGSTNSNRRFYRVVQLP